MLSCSFAIQDIEIIMEPQSRSLDFRYVCGCIDVSTLLTSAPKESTGSTTSSPFY